MELDHRRLAWDHGMPWYHALWVPLTYPWSERTKPLGGRAAAAHLVVVCVVFCVLVASGHLAEILTNNTYFVESWMMHPASYRCIRMAIKIPSDSPEFFVVADWLLPITIDK